MALSVLGRAFGVRSSKLLMERGGNLALLQQVFAKTEACRSVVSGKYVAYVTESCDLNIY